MAARRFVLVRRRPSFFRRNTQGMPLTDAGGRVVARIVGTSAVDPDGTPLWRGHAGPGRGTWRCVDPGGTVLLQVRPARTGRGGHVELADGRRAEISYERFQPFWSLVEGQDRHLISVRPGEPQHRFDTPDLRVWVHDDALSLAEATGIVVLQGYAVRPSSTDVGFGGGGD